MVGYGVYTARYKFSPKRGAEMGLGSRNAGTLYALEHSYVVVRGETSIMVTCSSGREGAWEESPVLSKPWEVIWSSTAEKQSVLYSTHRCATILYPSSLERLDNRWLVLVYIGPNTPA